MVLFTENILKYNRIFFAKKFVELSLSETNEIRILMDYLINDLSFLNEESIIKLWEIKKFQDLTQDIEKFSKLDPEVKQFEKEKFINSDRNVRLEIKVINFYISSLKNLLPF